MPTLPADVVDVRPCLYCGEPIYLTVRRIKNKVRYHKGHCANASRGLTWSEARLTAHMEKMRAAARRTRQARLSRRVARFAAQHTTVRNALVAAWTAGYKAGYRAKRRHEAR